MALMMTLDDAVKVLKNIGSFGEDLDDEDYEFIRSELEQKCYMVTKSDKQKSWLDEIRQDIENVTSPDEIARHIAEGDLKKWLEMYRDNIIAEITSELGEKNDRQEN